MSCWRLQLSGDGFTGTHVVIWLCSIIDSYVGTPSPHPGDAIAAQSLTRHALLVQKDGLGVRFPSHINQSSQGAVERASRGTHASFGRVPELWSGGRRGQWQRGIMRVHRVHCAP